MDVLPSDEETREIHRDRERDKRDKRDRERDKRDKRIASELYKRGISCHDGDESGNNKIVKP